MIGKILLGGVALAGLAKALAGGKPKYLQYKTRAEREGHCREVIRLYNAELRKKNFGIKGKMTPVKIRLANQLVDVWQTYLREAGCIGAREKIPRPTLAGLGSTKKVHLKQRKTMLAIGKNHLREFDVAMRRGQCKKASQELQWASISFGAAAENDAHFQPLKGGMLMFSDPQITQFDSDLGEASEKFRSACIRR